MRTVLTISGVCLCAYMSVLLMAGCSSASQKPPPVHFAEDDYAHATGADTLPKVHTVIIEQMKFTPESVTVKKGDTVLFLNHDMVVHDITRLPDSAWTSGPLPANASWKLVATKSSDYFCSIHPVMKGKIAVQ